MFVYFLILIEILITKILTLLQNITQTTKVGIINEKTKKPILENVNELKRF